MIYTQEEYTRLRTEDLLNGTSFFKPTDPMIIIRWAWDNITSEDQDKIQESQDVIIVNSDFLSE